MKRILPCVCAIGLLLGSGGQGRAELIGVVTLTADVKTLPFSPPLSYTFVDSMGALTTVTDVRVTVGGSYDLASVEYEEFVDPFGVVARNWKAPLIDFFIEVEGVDKRTFVSPNLVVWSHWLRPGGFFLENWIALVNPSPPFGGYLARLLPPEPYALSHSITVPASIVTTREFPGVQPSGGFPIFVSANITVTPEPSALALLVIGATGLMTGIVKRGITLRQRRKS